MRLSILIFMLGIGSMLCMPAVLAQTKHAGNHSKTSGDGAITQLREWHHIPAADARRMHAKHLLNIEVFGPDGEEIGNVEDVIIEHGAIAAIIAEVGGFWDIGDVHVAVPWQDVEVVADGLAIPVQERNFEQYALYHESSYVNQGYLQEVRKADAARANHIAAGAKCAHPGDQALPPGSCAWRLTALIDDYVTLEDGAGSGILEDMLFSENGVIQAIVVEWAGSAYGYGAYAFPFDGYAAGRVWNPHDRVYVLPYSRAQIGAMRPFHYGNTNWFWQ